MHVPAYFLEIYILAFALSGAAFSAFTRLHFAIGLVASCLFIFLAQCVLHIASQEAVGLFGTSNALVLYAMMSLYGLIPASIGAGMVRLIRRWRAI